MRRLERAQVFLKRSSRGPMIIRASGMALGSRASYFQIGSRLSYLTAAGCAGEAFDTANANLAQMLYDG